MDPTAPDVKPRRYDATRRRQAAARTRQRVVEVAEAILLRDGYAATTVGAIARAADVSVELVYKTFGGKAGLVREIQRVALEGAGPTSAETRSDAASSSPDLGAEGLLHAWAVLSTEVAPRVSPIMLLVQAAAAHDPELAAVHQAMEEQRLQRMAHNAQRLTQHPGLRDDLTLEEVRDVMWVYSSADLYDLLVLQRGWPLEDYGDFLFRGMSSQLLQCAGLDPGPAQPVVG